LERGEDYAHRALHVLVGIEHDLVAFEYKSGGQGKVQLTLGRLVQFATMEAQLWGPGKRNRMLRHGCFFILDAFVQATHQLTF
jgi:hypothetical protein